MNKDEERQKFLESESEYLRSLADILETDSDWFGNNAIRNVMIGFIKTMRNRADKIDALLNEARLYKNERKEKMEEDDFTYKQKAGMYRDMVDKLGDVFGTLDSLGSLCELLNNNAQSEIESATLMLARAISDIIKAAQICEVEARNCGEK